MIKKYIALILAFCMCMCCGIIASATEVDKFEIGYDFTDDTEGEAPKNLTVYAIAGDGEYCRVKNFENNNVAEMKIEKNGGDPAIVIDRSFTGKSKISFRLYIPEVTVAGQVISSSTNVFFKDLTNNKFTDILSFSGTTLKFLKDSVTGVVVNKNEWHDIEIAMDEITNEITFKLDGVEYTSDKNLLYANGSIDYGNLSFRIQTGCWTNVTAEEYAYVYVDDINIYKIIDVMPVITLKGNDTVYVNQGDIYKEPGYTAFDDIDGDISEFVSVSGDVNTDVPGQYTLTYSVENSIGIAAESVTRTVIVRKIDTIDGKPQRQLKGYTFEDDTIGEMPAGLIVWPEKEKKIATVQHEAGRKALRLQAIKNNTELIYPAIVIDKDFTGTHKIEFMLYIPEVDKTNNVKVMMKDLVTGNFIDMIEQTGSKIKFFGEEISEFVLNEKTWYNVKIYLNSETQEAGLRINETDYKEGKSVAGLNMNYNKLSFRLQFYNHENNNIPKIAYIDDLYIYTFAKPVITLKGDEEVKVNLGEKYVEAGWSAVDAVDGDITDKVEVSGEVDVNTENEYILEYNVAAKDGTNADTVSRKVIVRKRKIAAEANVSAGSEQPGFPSSNVNDENTATLWKPVSDEESITLNFENDTLIDETLIIGENIESGTWYVSNDGSSWLEIDVNEQVLQNGVAYKFEKWQILKYLKYTVSGKDLSVAEIECSVSPLSITQADKENVTVPELESSIVSENINLPKYGIFGSKIVWTSSNSSVISSEGIVISSGKDEKVTLTAEFIYEDASAKKTFPEVTVKGSSLFGRELYKCDFETYEAGKTITPPKEWGVWDGTLKAVKTDDTTAAHISAVSEASKPFTIYMDRSFEGETRMSLDLYNKDTNGTLTIMYKDNSSGNFINVFAIDGNKFKVFDKEVGFKIESGKWYNFSIENNSKTNDTTIKVNGNEYVQNGKLTYKYPEIDYKALSFRIVARGNVEGKAHEIYLDDLLLYSLAKPVINLKGEKVVELAIGEEYKEPGYTAEDEIDGNITDLVKVENNIDSSQPGEYTVKYTVTTRDGVASAEETRTVIVKKKNLMENAETTIDKIENSTVITVGFKENVTADTVVMSENASGGFVLEYSVDGKEWKKIDVSVNGSELTFEPIDAKYIRYTAEDGQNITMEAVNVDNKSIVALDLADLQLEASGVVSNDLILAVKGKRGSIITWKSSNTNAVLDNGTIMKPSGNTSVVMTATATYFDVSQSKVFPSFTVKGSGKNQGGGGTASGGSGGTSIVKNTDTPVYVPPVISENTNTGKFNDVSADYWAKTYIEKLAEKKIISGVTSNSFEPERSITREEFLKLLVSSLNITADKKEAMFDDVINGEWYEEYVLKAYGAGIVNGINENVFGVGEFITRQDMAVMVMRGLKYLGREIEEKEELKVFVDSAEIAAYAELSVNALQQAGILSGNENNEFQPMESLTRAQAAKVIYMLVMGE